MSGGARSYPRAGGVRVSTTLLALIFALTGIGLIPAVFMLAWAWGRVDLDEDGLRHRPFGGAMRWADVQRLGVGVKTGTWDRNQPTAVTFSTVHVLLRDGAGRTVAVHCGNHADANALLDDIKRRAGVAPEPLDVSFPFNRLSFRS